MPPVTPPHELPDLSVMGMFMGADVIVKSVMVLLLVASLATWSIWIVKALDLKAGVSRLRSVLDVLEDASTLDEAGRRLQNHRGPEGVLIACAQEERAATAERMAHGPLCREGVKERVASRLERLEAGAARAKSRGLGLLATVGSSAPFIGLFGTVWGIMNSFIGIAAAQTTNLAVVAPGIAEALLATALGLVAAIPAVILYNMSTRQIGAYAGSLRDASTAVMRLLSRDLEAENVSVLRAAG